MIYLLYVAVKLLAYSAWCWVGLRWLRNSGSISAAAGYGIVRLFVGIVFGVVIFFSYQPPANNLLAPYIGIYAPVRLLEWLIIAGVFAMKSATPMPRGKALLWCLGGILVSFAADLASPEGVAGHFCIGRCLC
jgi:hypothetical protein